MCIRDSFYDKELFRDSRDWGLVILRVIPSFYLFYYHGMRKIGSGVETWEWLGEAAMPVIGVSFGYVFFVTWTGGDPGRRIRSAGLLDDHNMFLGHCGLVRDCVWPSGDALAPL